MRKIRDVGILVAAALPIEAAILYYEDQGMLILFAAAVLCSAISFVLRKDDPIIYRLCLGVGVALASLIGALVISAFLVDVVGVSAEKKRHIADGLGWAIAGSLPFSGAGMLLALFGISYVERPTLP